MMPTFPAMPKITSAKRLSPPQATPLSTKSKKSKTMPNDQEILDLQPVKSENVINPKKHIPKYTGVKSKRIPKPLIRISDKHLALQALQKEGSLNNSQIARALGYSNQHAHELKKSFEMKSIVSPRIQRAAKRALLETLELKPVTRETSFKGEKITYEDAPTHKDRMDAVREVMARTDVVKTRTESLSIHGNMGAEGFSSALGELMTYKAGKKA